jgi:hypothetical protein
MIEAGRFRAEVHRFQGEASLSLTFKLTSDGKGFTWHLRYHDITALKRVIEVAGQELEQLYLEMEAGKRRT